MAVPDLRSRQRTAQSRAVAPPGADSSLSSGFDGAEFRGVQIGGRAVKVRIKHAAVGELCSRLSNGNGEVLGLLFGSHSAQGICIERFEPLPLPFPPGMTLAAWIPVATGRFLSSPADSIGETQSLVGLFRTHPAGRAEMIAPDVELLSNLRLSPLQCRIFLLIRRSRNRPWSATLFAADTKNESTLKTPVLEFSFNENLLRKRSTHDFSPTFEPLMSTEVPPGARKQILDYVMALAPGKVSRWTVLILFLGTLLGGAMVYRYSPSAPRAGVVRQDSVSEQLGLKVNRNGNDFEISWSRSSKAVLEGLQGKLTIQDGHNTRIVELDAAQLREGKILYSALFRELNFKLEIEADNQRTIAESVRVLGWDATLGSDLAGPINDPIPNPAGLIAGGDETTPRVARPEKEAQKAVPEPTNQRPDTADLRPAVKLEVIPPQSNRTVRAFTPPAQSQRSTGPERPILLDPAPVLSGPVNTAASSLPEGWNGISLPELKAPPVTTEPPVSQQIPVAPQIRQGGKVQEPKAITKVAPVYPPFAKATHIQGTVRFNAIIGKDGTIKNLKLISGPMMLVQPATDAVKQWLYQPALINGEPTEMITQIDLDFSLSRP
jgi:protein TonB